MTSLLAVTCSLRCATAEEVSYVAPVGADEPVVSEPSVPAGPALTGWQLPPGVVQFGPTVSNSPFCGNRLPPPTMPFGLLVPVRTQETPNWCMLASMQMVVGTYGLTVDQCRLVDQREEFPEGTCCASPYDKRCDRGTDGDQTIRLFKGLGFYGAIAPGPISEDELIAEIGNGRPVLFIEASSTGAHAIVATGYDPSPAGGKALYAIFDPVTGYDEMSYDDMFSFYWSSWSVWPATFYRLSPSPDGCNRDFDPDCGCTGGAQ